MATFLSPAVYANEIDLSTLPGGSSSIFPAFIGTANKGPMNTPVLVTNSSQYVDTFGEPFPESYLGYAVIAYFEEGSSCWVMRVGVTCSEGQTEELSDICIDDSGSKGSGWGRIPVFKGIDFGTITTRVAGTNGWSFHNSSITFDSFNDSEVSTTDGPTSASLTFTTGDYTGSIDDGFLVIITGVPTGTGSSMDGATYSIIRSSDGIEVSSGTIVESGTIGTSEDISIGDGVVIQVVVASGILDINDTFRFSVAPNNREFSFLVNHEDVGGVSAPEKPVTFTMPVANYATAADFANAVNALANGVGYDSSSPYNMSAQEYYAIENDDETVSFKTETAGHSLQLYSTEAFALEIGQSLYAFDIPRSNLIGLQPGPFNITSSNNIVKVQVSDSSTIKEFTATIPTGTNVSVGTVASAINASATVLGDTLVRAYALTIPGGDEVLVVETTDNNSYSIIKMMANGSNSKTLKFAEETGINYPYTESYRGFNDTRLELPAGGTVTESIPLSCETLSDPVQCQADSNYYENIVGWLVAPTPGTWVDNLKVNLDVYSGSGIPVGRYELKVMDSNNNILTRYQNVSFDPREEDQYIGVLINPTSENPDVGGDSYIRWIERPSFLGNDLNDLSSFEVRLPAAFFDKSYTGQANGIPTDPVYSSELDAAVIGNPADMTGIYKFSNPESYDISLMVVPGFTSGAVITTALSVCSQRGDCFYIVDSPFGLNTSQVVDWHNGLLYTDLSVALDSSYGGLYHPWVKIFDKFNGGEIWVPPSGHVAAVFARTDRVSEMWFAPAGLQRGKLNILDVEYEHTRGERDYMYGYNNAVNPVIKFPQRGPVIWGQRTLQRKDSALDRINVRMLMISIKKVLAGPNGVLNEFLFEQNDRITRNLIKTTIDNLMNDYASRRGVDGWKTICDESNNTPARIDRNETWVALLVKPTKVTEYISLNIGILRSDQSFSASEVVAAVSKT
jgi:phage tail sheath protein FI